MEQLLSAGWGGLQFFKIWFLSERVLKKLSLRIPEGTKYVRSFMYVGEKYNSAVGKGSSKFNQRIDCLYWSVLYAIRYPLVGLDSPTNNFDCIDARLLDDLKNIKPQLNFTNKHWFFEQNFIF